MLNVQVEYWKLQETKRHNVVAEELTRTELAEIARHNLATETETNRHNVVTEKQTDRQIRETIRHNKATEAIGRTQAAAAMISANAAQRQAGAAETNAAANLTKAVTSYQMGAIQLGNETRNTNSLIKQREVQNTSTTVNTATNSLKASSDASTNLGNLILKAYK